MNQTIKSTEEEGKSDYIVFYPEFSVSSLLYVTTRGIVSHLLLLHTSIYVKKLWLARIISDPEIRLRHLSRDIVLCCPLKTPLYNPE